MGRQEYRRFAKLNGSHPFRTAVPDGFVDYAARRLPGGNVVWFNFDLGRETGLIRQDHPNQLTAALRRAILDTFCITIINEYDLDHGNSYPDDRLPGRFMATRYLQLQHPGRTGRTSGDGRSIWNGELRHRNKSWDISSCGTGVTRLCPATAEQNQFFKTGNRKSNYGCGTASVEEGISAALMSETFHRNGIATERVLAVLKLANGFAITVRAAPSLIRPSHFFGWLKQNRLEPLRGVADLYVERQQTNGKFPRLKGARRYRHLARQIAIDFGRSAARFEADYIFCWLDWDGDNCLCDGGIIDYGSVRQFGLYHSEYRFDDGPRWSTSLAEQRSKARHIVQAFAQIRDFLIDGKKSPLRGYSDDDVVRLFDETFERERRRLLLKNSGIPQESIGHLLNQHPASVERYRRAHAYFERARSARGPVEVGDGLNWNAIFSTRDILRELPDHLLRNSDKMSGDEFLEVATSSYATADDQIPTAARRRMASEFQRSYWALIDAAASHLKRTPAWILSATAHRSAVINRFDRITGDAALYATRRLIANRRRLSDREFHAVIQNFLELQTRNPDRSHQPHRLRGPNAKRVFDTILGLTSELRYGL